MQHRERVLTALRHQEPDRVPIDLGGTDGSTMMINAYRAFRRHLGLGPGEIHVADIFQQVVMVEEDVRQALGVDVVPIFKEPDRWREEILPDGAPIQLPAKFRPQLRNDGSQIVLDDAGNAVLQAPKDGLYFDPVYAPLADVSDSQDLDQYTSYIENYDWPFYLDKSLEQLAGNAKALRQNTDYLLVGQFGGHIFEAGRSLRGWDTFLIDLLVNPKLAQALMDRVTEANIRHFERYAETVGRHVDVVAFNEDLGMQDRTLISPELYRRMIKPYQKRLFSFAKSRCNAYLLLHSCGAVAPFIPDFIEMGVDALNPVQVSAAGMDTRQLKKEFGQDIVFWGGGCDTQTVLPLGVPEDVQAEVKRRIDDLAPGGGFIFCPVHNVQDGVSSENLTALYKTALEYGVY